MRDTNLILVEGMPGTGKSTVSQFIHLQLRAVGRRSCWWHEERHSHPLQLFYQPQRHATAADYVEEAASLWQRFVDESRGQHEVIVLDGSLFQNHVRSMLIHDCARQTMLALVVKVAGLLRPLNPVLVYLRPLDVETNFRNVVDARGRRMLDLWIEAHNHYPYTRRTKLNGYPGFIAFWKEFAEVADLAFDRLAIAKLAINLSTGDWPAHYDRLLRFLDLPMSAASPSPQELARFAGHYLPVNDEAACEFSLRVDGDHLVATVDRPTIDVRRGPIGCFREVRLLPAGEDRFHVAAWPHVAQFAADREGTIVNMRLDVSEIGWPQTCTVYARAPA